MGARIQKKVLDRISLIRDLLEKFGSMTVRQIYYQLVPLDLSYRAVQYACQVGRVHGLLPVEKIVDRSRPSYGLNKWSDLDEALETLEYGFQLDYWAESPYKVEVWTEKDALSQILYEEAGRYRVPVRVTRGFLSTSLKHEWSGFDLVILYFGDFDPSGLYMDVDLQNNGFLNFAEFRRIALTQEQIEEYNLPFTKVKRGDPRYEQYVKEHGLICWELDALPPDVLRKMVREAIEDLLTFDLEQKRREEEEIRNCIREIREKEKGRSK